MASRVPHQDRAERQIGVRDEAKMMGGLGICGRPFCCTSFLGEFQPVSIKMAKEQGLSLNPVKISGTCGRLMCCLKYEQEAYSDLLRTTPKNGAVVNTPEGRGVVVDVNTSHRDAEGEDGPGSGGCTDVLPCQAGQGHQGFSDQGGERGSGEAEGSGGLITDFLTGIYKKSSCFFRIT